MAKMEILYSRQH